MLRASAMGWLQLVGSIRLQVFFAKEPYKRDDILPKRPIILSIVLTVATPHRFSHCFHTEEWALASVCLRVCGCVCERERERENMCVRERE